MLAPDPHMRRIGIDPDSQIGKQKRYGHNPAVNIGNRQPADIRQTGINPRPDSDKKRYEKQDKQNHQVKDYRKNGWKSTGRDAERRLIPTLENEKPAGDT